MERGGDFLDGSWRTMKFIFFGNELFDSDGVILNVS